MEAGYIKGQCEIWEYIYTQKKWPTPLLMTALTAEMAVSFARTLHQPLPSIGHHCWIC